METQQLELVRGLVSLAEIDRIVLEHAIELDQHVFDDYGHPMRAVVSEITRRRGCDANDQDACRDTHYAVKYLGFVGVLRKRRTLFGNCDVDFDLVTEVVDTGQIPSRGRVGIFNLAESMATMGGGKIPQPIDIGCFEQTPLDFIVDDAVGEFIVRRDAQDKEQLTRKEIEYILAPLTNALEKSAELADLPYGEAFNVCRWHARQHLAEYRRAVDRDVFDRWDLHFLAEHMVSDLRALHDFTTSRCARFEWPQTTWPAEVQLRKLLTASSSRTDVVDVQIIVPTLQGELRKLQAVELAFPAPLPDVVYQEIFGRFRDAALPFTEADSEGLILQFVATVGNLLGRSCFANFGPDYHYPAVNPLIIGKTGCGKGQAWSSVRSCMSLVDELWLKHHVRYSAASGEGLVKLVSMVKEDGQDGGDGRLFLIVPETAILINSMNREGSNLSGYIRQAYDGLPLENNRSKERVMIDNYLLSVMGHITAEELCEILGNVDFYNGVTNRFIWAAVKKSKTLPRMTKMPEFAGVADELKELLDLPHAGHVQFSDAAAKVWDEWVCSLPELEGKLGASQERAKPNALRLALIYAAYDRSRLVLRKSGHFEIGPEHVEAAIAIITRSRQTVEWFLNQPMKVDSQAGYGDIVKVRTAMNQNDGEVTGVQLHQLFSHHSADQRMAIASRAGLKLRKIAGDRGKPREVWTW